MREKLIELVGSTEYGNGSLVGKNFQEGFIAKIADHLLANGVIVLPCKVGDTVWEVHNNTDACSDCHDYCAGFGDAWCDRKDVDVDSRYYPCIAEKPVCEKQFMEIIEFVPSIDFIFNHRKEFGKTVFLTREAAEAALRKED